MFSQNQAQELPPILIPNATSEELEQFINHSLIFLNQIEKLKERLTVLSNVNENKPSDDTTKVEEEARLEHIQARLETLKNEQQNKQNKSISSQENLVFPSSLPSELIQLILNNLSFYDRVPLTTVSKQFRKIIIDLTLCEQFIFGKAYGKEFVICTAPWDEENKVSNPTYATLKNKLQKISENAEQWAGLHGREVIEDVRAQLPRPLGKRFGLTTFWASFGAMFLVAFASLTYIGIMSSCYNKTGGRECKLSQNQTIGFLIGLPMAGLVVGFLAAFTVWLTRELYLQSLQHTTERTAKKLFGLFSAPNEPDSNEITDSIITIHHPESESDSDSEEATPILATRNHYGSIN